MKAWFLGMLQVDKPCGIDVIHGAIERLMDTVPRAEWKSATVSVAPSTVTIAYSDPGAAGSGKKGGGGGSPHQHQLDCRVRFLSFLGIGLDARQAAFVMHTAQDTFVAHVFHVEPSAGPLCKTIEAACKLRYQKCLDARPQQQGARHAGDGDASGGGGGGRASIGASIKNMLGSWTTRGRIQSPQNPAS